MRRLIDGRTYNLAGAERWHLREDATGFLVAVLRLTDGTWLLEEIDATAHRHGIRVATPEDVAGKFAEHVVDIPPVLSDDLAKGA